MKTIREIETTVGASGSRIRYPVTVPAGVRCVRLGLGLGRWVVDDLSWLSPKDAAYWDAEHRGIEIAAADLSE